MPTRPIAITAHPLIAKLEKLEKPEVVVTISGYAGTPTNGSVRIYQGLSLESYVEVPQDAILDSKEDQTDGKISVMVMGSTEVLVASVSRQLANEYQGATHAQFQYQHALNMLTGMQAQMHETLKAIIGNLK